MIKLIQKVVKSMEYWPQEIRIQAVRRTQFESCAELYRLLLVGKFQVVFREFTVV
jgi:hypothetical protein